MTGASGRDLTAPEDIQQIKKSLKYRKKMDRKLLILCKQLINIVYSHKVTNKQNT